ncbi:MAG: PKD domain-containing protein [Flavobacteriaceae bacterium]
MTPHPTKVSILALLFLGFFLFNSCSKDIDILTDAILDDQVANVEERNNSEEEAEESSETEEESQTEETPEEEPPAEESMEDGFESRTTVFNPSHDAYIQSGKGYNQHIIRLDEDHRTSYLLFDISAIEDIGGYVTGATLQFTISGDEGNGTINVHKGLTSDWTETNLAEGTVPGIDIMLGNLIKEYKIGATEEIVLSASDLIPEKTTLIMEHQEGNDLAFASKEHPSKIGPKLVVTYNAPEDAQTIVIEEEPSAPAEEGGAGEGANESNSNENAAPMAIADATPSSGGVPLEVRFTGSNSSDDNEITSYSWDFKDGSTSSATNPTHTFTEVGSYDVELTVTDAEGLSSTDNVTITVNEESNEAPVARASATPRNGTAPLEVSFTGSNSSDDNGVASYSWNFKDGSNSSNANPNHTFNDPGTYVVELTVADENGLTDKASVTITVTEASQNEAPVAVASANPITGDAPLTVQFNSSNSTDDVGITSYYWDLPNDPSAAPNPSRTFNDPGVYVVTLTVTDAEGLTDSDSVTITVNQASGGSGGSGGGGSGGNYPPNAVFASDFGFNANDATDAFRDAIFSSSNYIVIDKQNSDWILSPTSISNISNKTIVFEPGVVVRAKAGAYPLTNHTMVRFNSFTNVTIEGYGATFRMNKSEYTNGEHRHALSIRNGNNVTVKGLTFRDAGGDGIIVSGISPGDYSRNITIEDVVCVNNRRNGLSITSARDVWVRNSEFNQSNGTNPEVGVDLEPNYQSDRLVNINFNNCKFTGNDSAGFQVGTGRLTSSSIPISVQVRDCIFNHNSKSPNGKAGTEIILSEGSDGNPVRGDVLFERNTFNGSNTSVLFSKKSAEAFDVEFRNCDAYNVAKNGIGAVINLEASSNSNTLGGFTFSNFHMEYNTNIPFMQVRGPNTMTFKNVNGSFTIDEPYNNPLKYAGSYNPSNNVNVSINYNHIN